MSDPENAKKRYDGSICAELLTFLRSFAGESCPGRQYPSQWQLSRKFNISRSTVEKAFKILENEGLLEKKKGAGSFVPGRKTIRFLMPGKNILTRMDSDGFTVRERLEGCMNCATERNLGIELLYLSPNDNMFEMDCQSIRNLNNSSMIVLQDWFFTAFPEIEKKSLKSALISSGNINYGSNQYIRQWNKFIIDRPGGITQAMQILYDCGCRRIAIAGHYINYCQGLEIAAYRNFISQHNMPELSAELSSSATSYSPEWREKIAALYQQGRFDGLLIFCREYLAVQKSIHEYLNIPENVKIIAWNFFKELAPGIPPLPCFNPQNRQIGYDAVNSLLDSSRRGISKVYQVEFKNLTAEMQQIYERGKK